MLFEFCDSLQTVQRCVTLFESKVQKKFLSHYFRSCPVEISTTLNLSSINSTYKGVDFPVLTVTWTFHTGEAVPLNLVKLRDQTLVLLNTLLTLSTYKLSMGLAAALLLPHFHSTAFSPLTVKVCCCWELGINIIYGLFWLENLMGKQWLSEGNVFYQLHFIQSRIEVWSQLYMCYDRVIKTWPLTAFLSAVGAVCLWFLSINNKDTLFCTLR